MRLTQKLFELKISNKVKVEFDNHNLLEAQHNGFDKA